MRTEGVYALVREAIEARRQVHATYRGHRRSLCPHVLGFKDGRARALFFQFAGGSEGGLEPGGDWRCLDLDEMSEVSVREGLWHTRPHADRQRCVTDVELEIQV